MARRTLKRGTSVNARLFDDVVHRATMLERFKNGQVREIIGMLNRQVVPDLADKLSERLAKIKVRGFDTSPETTARLRDLLEATETTIGTGMRKVGGKFASSL